MKKILFVSLSFFMLVACNSKEQVAEENVKENKELKDTPFTMYDMTEGALLMEEMYAHNTQLKSRILSNAPLGDMPEKFSNLPYVALTDPSDKDEFYLEKAAEFLVFQKAIYTSEDPKKAFNDMVESCIVCHTKKCGGPIPRIKKLMIP